MLTNLWNADKVVEVILYQSSSRNVPHVAMSTGSFLLSNSFLHFGWPHLTDFQLEAAGEASKPDSASDKSRL